MESDIDKFGNMLPSEVEAKLTVRVILFSCVLSFFTLLQELAGVRAQLSGLNNKVDDMERLINSSEELEVDPMNKGDLVDQMRAVKKKMKEVN